MRAFIALTSILLGGFLVLWVVCSLVMQCQGFQ